jgi:hypothetical protein
VANESRCADCHRLQSPGDHRLCSRPGHEKSFIRFGRRYESRGHQVFAIRVFSQKGLRNLYRSIAWADRQVKRWMHCWVMKHDQTFWGPNMNLLSGVMLVKVRSPHSPRRAFSPKDTGRWCTCYRRQRLRDLKGECAFCHIPRGDL